MHAWQMTKRQLADEVELLRRRVAELESLVEGSAKKEADRLDNSHFLQTLLDTIPSPIFFKDAAGLYLGCNKAFESFLGLSKQQVVGKSVYDIAPKDLADKYREMDTALFEQPGIQTYEASVKYADGSRHDVIFYKATFTDADERVAGMVGVMLDITERKEAEKVLLSSRSELEARVLERTAELAEANRELRVEVAEREKAEMKIRHQHEFLNHVIESLTHPFYVLDANTYEIVMANSAAAPDGIPPGATCHAMTHRRASPCGGPEHGCSLDVIKRTRQPFTVDHVHYDRDGNPRNVEVHAYPIFDNEGNVAQIIEYALDITERKRLEEELHKNAEKIKLFAYSVSHDLKSPLIGINGLTRLLHKQYRDVLDDRGKKYCDQILKASEQVVSLVEEVNLYIKTKEAPLRFETVDLKEVIAMVRDEFGALLGTRRINWSEPHVLPEIRADRMSLLRVFRNLVDNALKYGGDVLSEIRIEYAESPGAHVFGVIDDGMGIKEEDREEVFELFQRGQTDPTVEGTGLGLAIVKEIADKHKGKVWVESGAGSGSAFYVAISKDL
jgi:PAS domain S-box-containing protein